MTPCKSCVIAIVCLALICATLAAILIQKTRQARHLARSEFRCDLCREWFEEGERLNTRIFTAEGMGTFTMGRDVWLCNECLKSIRDFAAVPKAEVRDHE